MIKEDVAALKKFADEQRVLNDQMLQLLDAYAVEISFLKDRVEKLEKNGAHFTVVVPPK